MTKLKMGLAGFALIATSAIVFAQGQGFWPNWPQVGSAAYCAARGNNNVCTSTIPAGPTILTGFESIPANANPQAASQPQNVLINVASLNAAPLVFRVLTDTTSADTYTIPNNNGGVLYSYTTTIPSAAVTAPAAPIDGQRVVIASDRTITSFSFVANTGQSLSVTTPTVLTASTTVPQGYEFVYKASTTKWYRIR